MCVSLLLLSDAPLPLIRNAPEFPDLQITPLDGEYDSALQKLQQFHPAPYAAWISPAGNCGCAFCYCSREQLEVERADYAYLYSLQAETPQPLSLPEIQESTLRRWETYRTAIHSFGRLVATIIPKQELSYYVCWDNQFDVPCVQQTPLRPAYFSGPCVPELPENTISQFVPDENGTGRGSSSEQLALQLIGLGQDRGQDLTPLYRAAGFEQGDRYIRFSGPLLSHDPPESIQYVLRGSVQSLPSGNPHWEAGSPGRWTEYGKLGCLEESYQLLQGWLIDRHELDALAMLPYESHGWALG